ncbi:DUF1467 family protein [bacterium]|nr:DUF1467 family protein [bacterium]
MDFPSFIVVFSFSWWLFFFLLLPIGNQVEEAPVPGQSTGAPAGIKLGKKAVWATILCLLFTGMYFAVIHYGHLSIEKMLHVKNWQEWEQKQHEKTQ